MNSTKIPSPLRLILVEDNKHDVLAFKRALRESNLSFEITHYARAEPALEQLSASAEAFDVVVCDFNLPGMTGFDLCKTVIEREIDLPLILLTGSGAESLAVDALKIGVSDYIIKDPNQGYLNLLPVVLGEVVRKHNDHLARQQAEALLTKRERYLAALVKVQQQLLALDHNQNFYEGILQPLGQAANASRVYVFENDPHPQNLTAHRVADWYAPEMPIEVKRQAVQHVDYRVTLPRWKQALAEGAVIAGLTESFPAEERGYLESKGILAILMFPLIANGEFIGLIGFENCKTVRMWEPAEIEMLHAAAAGISLWQERRQADATLRQYTEQLQAHNAELDAFAHTVAHDLKNPIGALTGIAEILAEDYEADKQLYHYLCSIIRSGRKAQNIIAELLLLASVRQQDDIVLEALDMAKIVAGTQERLQYQLLQSNAQLVLPTVWPLAWGYGPWIEEIWANYISNGLKYGGDPPYLELGATEQPDGQLRFWIKDNGLGLTPEERERLFTPFTQLKPAKAQGHGLGLSIVRRIAEKLGGEVGVEGAKGEGSTFYFTLPPVR